MGKNRLVRFLGGTCKSEPSRLFSFDEGTTFTIVCIILMRYVIDHINDICYIYLIDDIYDSVSHVLLSI